MVDGKVAGSSGYNDYLNGYIYIFYGWGNTKHCLTRGAGSSNVWLCDMITATPAQQNNYYELEARWLDADKTDGDNLFGLVDGEIPAGLEARDGEYTSRTYLGFASWSNAEWRVDRVYVRKCASVEPVTEMGREFNKPAISTPMPTPQTTTFEYDDYNKLTEITFPDSTTETLSYDDNGQLVRREKSTGEVTGYEWNDQGMLVKVVLPNGNPIIYRYDGNGNLVGRITADGDVSFIPEAMYYEKMIDRESGRTLSFNLASNLGICDGNGENEIFYLQDHLGSNIMTVNEDGEIVNNFSYDAYGNIMGAEGMIKENRLFVGTYGIFYDHYSGLHLMGARWYDKSIMRFLSPDILMGINRYSYVDGNPVNYIDLTGYKGKGITEAEALRRYRIYRGIYFFAKAKANEIKAIKGDKIRQMRKKYENAPLNCIEKERIKRWRKATEFIGDLGDFRGGINPCCIQIPINSAGMFDITKGWIDTNRKTIDDIVEKPPKDNKLFFLDPGVDFGATSTIYVPNQAIYIYENSDPKGKWVYFPNSVTPRPGMWAAYLGGSHSGVIGLDRNGNLIHIMVTNPLDDTNPSLKEVEKDPSWWKKAPQRVVEVLNWSRYKAKMYFDYPIDCKE